MSMIEKFLEGKSALCEDLDKIREEAMKAASDRADARIDEFVEDVKAMVAEASNEEFVEFITSGKLEDDDIMAAITFRAQSTPKSHADVCEDVLEKLRRPVRVVVIGGIGGI